MASYSAFFSSGLLAPRQAYDNPTTPSKPKAIDGFPTPYGDSSPIRPASPLPTHSDAIVVDEPMELDYPSGRESTPTQHTVTASLQAAAKITSAAAGSSATAQAQPRLRRRRSSLTIAVSPLTSIRSPTRTVGAALQMQRHLAMNPGRSRGGSLSSSNPPSAVEGFTMFGMASSVASEGTSLTGRLRSGSVGSSVYRAPPPATAGITSRGLRKHVRRVTSVPAPVPPPSAPLPALPQLPFSAKSFPRTPFSYQNHDMPGSAGIPAAMSGQKLKGRDRGFSVSSTVGRIDEEMKEN
ncbi:hypothetical protein D9611_006054 [Ephemerocybe angulata]|uniref:Uncharacterized protein n=1 Tax=Ephemerocybe angulata TaxID=980116 RepID=A0A8H5CI30_9AGAR|nr:hypothetical protein D9611_006054 [Tulosesus angulatus]